MATAQLYAHRLGRAYGPDSSARALAGALRAGVDGLETDVCLTADEDLVLLHDPRLEVGTTLSGWAHQRPARDIASGFLRDRHGNPTMERPLFLDELLDATAGSLPIQVEVKAHADPALAGRTVATLCERYRRSPERARIEVISFHSAACAVKRQVGGVAVEHFLLTERLAAIFRLAGLSVSTGTVNHAELLRRVTDTAAPDSVCTDRPGELRIEA